MSLSLDPTLRALSDCGCCEGLSAETPAAVENRPGLTTIAYRVGTHATFKETLLSRLSTARLPSLGALTSREDDDLAIALLDAWAVVCDVLTFYQERIANEHYLRTATDLLSAVELARLVDYRQQPGVAASVDLAFTLEDAPGALGQALGVTTATPTGAVRQAVPAPPVRLSIDAGTKVQSIPGPGEQPQTFETTQSIEARAEWNAMRPRQRQRQVLSASSSTILFEGAATNLKVGDALLVFLSASDPKLRRVLTFDLEEDARATRVGIGGSAPYPPAFTRPSLPIGTIATLAAQTGLTDNVVRTAIVERAWAAADLAAAVRMQRWNVEALVESVSRQIAEALKPAGQFVLALRQRAALFGHNAPQYKAVSPNLRFGEILFDFLEVKQKVFPAFPTDWETLTLDSESGSAKNHVFLDSVYPSAVPGSHVVLTAPGTPLHVQVCKVTDNVEVTRSDFGLSAKVTRLTVEFVAPATPALSNFPIRSTTALLGSEPLTLAPVPVGEPIQGDTIVLDRMLLDLTPGQAVFVIGERIDPRGTVASEPCVLKSVLIEAGVTVLTLQKALEHSYLRATVSINANVAPATHGETVREVLGSGDASQSFQRFTLKQPPLTFVSAATATGADSTLEVRVDDVLWREVPTLVGRRGDERIYVTSARADGTTTVTFGDGITGARLPTGIENVRAAYRKGIGVGAILPANRITLLLSRPLGLKEATNPVASSGAADPESLNDVRRNAPLPIRTLGRIVSLQDYEDFARSFAGIAKSRATWAWNGTTRAVFVTVAGVSGAAVDPASDLHAHLLGAMLGAGDPTVPLTVASFRPRFFRMAANLTLDPDFLAKKVLREVEQRLRDRFSFDVREFGQPVALSEVMAAIQSVRGVAAVDMNELYRSDLSPNLNVVVPAAAPEEGAENPVGAELLTLDARPVALHVLP